MKNRNHKNPSRRVPNKDRHFTVNFIRNEIEKGMQIPFNEFLQNYPEIERYNRVLYFVTTTNKAACEAVMVPVEAGTRYKDTLESAGKLVSSVDDFTCPYTGYEARFISTNPQVFDELRKSDSNQLNLFDDEV
ncbi:hypothetical protein [Lentimicrobium sp. S6]|uniref:hypothetical protein n=1 Tax=Lentimicrobium sp. S6 TaxID=2735872 RepID=UPI0015541983|nr:hypothetical protein [Lentimicrobium sp. S6]NPD47615.1 hypothetical protein [Lentimicrobium sp. S6]